VFKLSKSENFSVLFRCSSGSEVHWLEKSSGIINIEGMRMVYLERYFFFEFRFCPNPITTVNMRTTLNRPDFIEHLNHHNRLNLNTPDPRFKTVPTSRSYHTWKIDLPSTRSGRYLCVGCSLLQDDRNYECCLACYS